MSQTYVLPPDEENEYVPRYGRQCRIHKKLLKPIARRQGHAAFRCPVGQHAVKPGEFNVIELATGRVAYDDSETGDV